MNLRKIVIIITLSFWPISLYLANTFKDFVSYALPAILIALSFYLHVKRYKFSFSPLLLIPVLSPKLAFFPFIFYVFHFFANIKSKNKQNLAMHLIFSFLLIIVFWKPFLGQTIVVPDYEAQQKVIRDQRLYPSIFMARTFSNKARIVTDKFTGNLLALTDPNNYFFSFHPREQSGNQDLPKFPFIALPFLVAGIFKLLKDKQVLYILPLLTALLLSLSVLTNYDRNDFALWIPLSYIIALGFTYLSQEYKKYHQFIYVYILFLIPDFIAIFLRFTK